MDSERAKLVVIGLDGATWQLLDPLIAQGRLPNLARLRREGASGVLRSCILPWTFPAWRVYSSGRNPGKLGVFWFSGVDWSRRTFYLNTASSFSGPDLWDYLNAHGIRTGVIDMPATYPPRPIDGFMISGYPAEEDKAFTYPLALQDEIRTKFGYKTYADASPDDPAAYVAEQQEIIRSRFAVARYLLDEVDFLHLTIFCIDQVQHHFWNDERLFQTWEVIDEELGRFVNQPRYTYLFMSDHGFGPGPITEVFQLNNWLAQEGYLRLRRHSADVLYRFGLTKRKALRIAKALGIDRWLRRNLPPSIRRAVPLRQEATGEAMMLDRAPLIDWERSQVLADGHGLLYFNPHLSPAQKNQLRRELLDKLTALRSPRTGLPVAAHVYTKEEIYHGPHLERAPDLILLGRDGCLIKDGIGGRETFQPPETERWNAKHALDGLFLGWGRHIQAGITVQDASLVDIAPTVLHLMGCPVPKDMDGRVLSEIFMPESEPARRAVTWMEALTAPNQEGDLAEEEAAVVVERLRDLGYL